MWRDFIFGKRLTLAKKKWTFFKINDDDDDIVSFTLMLACY